MHKALYLILLAVFAAGCSSDSLVEPTEMGAIKLALSSDIEVEVSQRTQSADYSNFIVDIQGTALYDGRALERHFDAYAQMPEAVELPYGSYTIAVQSCTENQAEEGWGCARYFGRSGSIDVRSQEPKAVNVLCKMANGKASLTLDAGFVQDFADISISLSVDARTVTLTGEEMTAPVGVYFNVPSAGSNLRYTITATVGKGTAQERRVSYNNDEDPILLSPGKCAKMTIKSNHLGLIGPGIDVNDDMEVDDSNTESIDPEGGESVTEFPTISILVDTQLQDATFVDCTMDVL